MSLVGSGGTQRRYSLSILRCGRHARAQASEQREGWGVSGASSRARIMSCRNEVEQQTMQRGVGGETCALRCGHSIAQDKVVIVEVSRAPERCLMVDGVDGERERRS